MNYEARKSILGCLLLIVTLAILFSLIPAGAQDDPWATPAPESWDIFAKCVSYAVEGLPYIEFWYALNGDYEYGYQIVDEIISNSEVLNLPAAYFYPGSEMSFAAWAHDGNVITWTVIMLATGETKSVTADVTSVPECEAEAKYGEDGGWVEITIENPSCDPCSWQIADEYGNWHDIGVQTPVQIEDEKRFTRLVLGRDNSIHDSSRYRVY